ncbi:sensor histidine kinase [Paractinoplanes globisporus]|uniref:histidine kinase n=1 Tax=Paractinoplanes globisporus TaxID=113565 RepID=A0ABW6W783_9ACTN|nr:HAMP domain-containing sensor histidine kinase [Actinoplanes globisporus]
MSRRRRTLRTQLTLLYAVPFVASGALLVTVPLLSDTDPVSDGPAPPAAADAASFPVATWSVTMILLVLVSLVLGWLVAGRFVRPLRAITATARDISATSLDRRLGDVGGTDEFAQLAATLDSLFERLEAAFTSQRHFVANASHELRTPLTAERALLQVALRNPDATIESMRDACREVLQLSAAQERLIEALFTLADGQRPVEHREPIDLAAIARTVLRSRPAEGLTVESTLEPAPAPGDPRLVESLVANLVDNAVRYNVPGGRVQVTTTSVPGGARLAVRNSGPIVPAAEIDRLFEPFQQLRRERTGGGHGLGLAIVRAIATAHGAALEVRARPTGGLDVEVTFGDHVYLGPND